MAIGAATPNLYRYVGNDPIDGFGSSGGVSWRDVLAASQPDRARGYRLLIGAWATTTVSEKEGWNPIASGGWAWVNQATGLGFVRTEQQRGEHYLQFGKGVPVTGRAQCWSGCFGGCRRHHRGDGF